MLGVLRWLNQQFKEKNENIKIYKRTKASKYSKDQSELPGQLYRKTSNRCFVIIDDEKYFSLSHTNIPGHVYYYTSDKSAALPDIKYKKRSKYQPKIIWLTISSKGVCEPYTFIEVNADVYLNEN